MHNSVPPSAITLTKDRTSEIELLARAARQFPTGQPVALDPSTSSILFLRAAASRAAMALPAFYLLLASTGPSQPASSVPGYAGVVFRHAINFSSISTVTLACRKLFDHKATGMTGAWFGKRSDADLARIATYWADKSSRPFDDALAALKFLRSVFQHCARTSNSLLAMNIPLCQRIGLLKQHGDREAAHLSMENYEFTPVDSGHVIAAMTIIGTIINSFDAPQYLPSYFDDVDEAAASAATHLFPAASGVRLFQHFRVETQARLCWQWGEERGLQMLFHDLPYAMAWH